MLRISSGSPSWWVQLHHWLFLLHPATILVFLYLTLSPASGVSWVRLLSSLLKCNPCHPSLEPIIPLPLFIFVAMLYQLGLQC